MFKKYVYEQLDYALTNLEDINSQLCEIKKDIDIVNNKLDWLIEYQKIKREEADRC